jgi:hypothetical protein
MTAWVEKSPGQNAAVIDEDSGLGDSAVLVGLDRLDWIRLPEKLGGMQVRVLSREQTLCPFHKNHDCAHYHLDSGFSVAECDQFYWYRKVTP